MVAETGFALLLACGQSRHHRRAIRVASDDGLTIGKERDAISRRPDSLRECCFAGANVPSRDGAIIAYRGQRLTVAGPSNPEQTVVSWANQRHSNQSQDWHRCWHQDFIV